MQGHSVLAVPVPPLDEVVRARTAHYDRSFVSRDPGFVHAHITVLGPWISAPTPGDLALVERIAAHVAPVLVTLTRVEQFADNGLIHLRPEPEQPFRALTDALVEAFPDHPPYAGEFPDPVPHLSLDHPAGGVTLDDVRVRLEPWLPVTFVADRLDLQWWANDDCRLIRSFAVGGGHVRAHGEAVEAAR